MKTQTKILSVSATLLLIAIPFMEFLDNLTEVGGWFRNLFNIFEWNNLEHWKRLGVALGVLAVISTSFAGFYGWRYHRLSLRIDRATQRQRQPVLFVSPYRDGFYGEYLSALVNAARLHAGTEREITIVPYVTTEADFCPETRLDEILEDNRAQDIVYKGVFVIPRDPSENKDRLKSHLSLHHDLPIVTLDVYPDDKEDPEYPHFVGGNEQVGGRCAATAAIRLLEKLRKDGQWAHLGGPRVLVLIGTITPWEIQRVTCFEDELLRWSKENEVDLHLVKSRPLKYEYQQAVHYLSNWKAEVDGEEVRLSDPLKTDLIFACSDTMALGAAKAIRQLRQRQPEGAGSRVKVIGYDGTIGMKRALDADSDVLAATVDVQLGEQAKRAVEVMMNLMGGNPADRMKLVSPVVFEP